MGRCVLCKCVAGGWMRQACFLPVFCVLWGSAGEFFISSSKGWLAGAWCVLWCVFSYSACVGRRCVRETLHVCWSWSRCPWGPWGLRLTERQCPVLLHKAWQCVGICRAVLSCGQGKGESPGAAQATPVQGSLFVLSPGMAIVLWGSGGQRQWYSWSAPPCQPQRLEIDGGLAGGGAIRWPPAGVQERP